MLLRIFHSQVAAALATWLTLGTIAFAVLAWAIPDWFGPLTIAKALLIGIGGVLAASVVIALSTFVFALGFRRLKPNAVSDAIPVATQERFDDAGIQERIDSLTSMVDRLQGQPRDTQTPDARYTALSDRIDRQFEAIRPRLDMIEKQLAPILQERRDALKRRLIELFNGMKFPHPEPGARWESGDRPEHRRLRQFDRKPFIELGIDAVKLQDAMAYAAKEVQRQARYCSVDVGEKDLWRDGQSKEAWHVHNAKINVALKALGDVR